MSLISLVIVGFASLSILIASACSSLLTMLDEVCSIQISPLGIVRVTEDALDACASAVTSEDSFPLSSW